METPGGSLDQPSPIPPAEPTPAGAVNSSNMENQQPPTPASTPPPAQKQPSHQAAEHHHHHQQPQQQQQQHADPAMDSFASQLNAESAKIQIELERLKMRRRMIEDQRRALVAASPASHNNAAAAAPPASHHGASRSTSNQHSHYGGGGGNPRSTSSLDGYQRGASASVLGVHSHCGHRSSSAASAGELTNVVTHPGDLPPGGTQRMPISGELGRKRKCEQSAHYQMKEAIRGSLEHDSCIVGGTFMPNPHTSKQGTFGRAARFAVPIGENHYYLSYDQQQLQGPNCRRDRRVLTASSRGRPGSNVNSHWNDAKGGVAPGPGAYTPRYWFLSKGERKY